MPRPPREDRNTVGSRHLAFRLTQYEYELLVLCVAYKNEQMQRIGLPPLMNPTAWVKSLIVQEAERLLPLEEVAKRTAARYVLEPATGGADERAVAEAAPAPYGRPRAVGGEKAGERKSVVYGKGGKIVGTVKKMRRHED